MVLLQLFDESQTRLADLGYIPECKSKNPRGLNEISLPLARMLFYSVTYVSSFYVLDKLFFLSVAFELKIK